VVPPNFFVPPNAIAIRDPLVLYGSDEKEQVSNAIKSINFAKTDFKVTQY